MLRAVFALVLFATPVAASPHVAGGLEYTFGRGGHVEQLDLGLRLEAGLFLRVGRWQGTLSFPANPKIASANPERDTDELTGVGVGGRLAYRMPALGGIITLAGGITRRWVWGKENVMRTCEQTGDCIAGISIETPSYHAWAPQLRIGIGPEKLMTRMVMGASFEIIVEAIGLNDVPPDGIRNVTVIGAVTMLIGGGPRR